MQSILMMMMMMMVLTTQQLLWQTTAFIVSTSHRHVAQSRLSLSARGLQYCGKASLRMTSSSAAGTFSPGESGIPTGSQGCITSSTGSIPCDIAQNTETATIAVLPQEALVPPAAPTSSSSMRTSSLNLLKNMVGAGVFSLNSRVMSISTNPMAIIPAATLIFTMAMWATYNFYMVGETCRLTDSATYSEAWSKTVSANSQWIIQSVVVISPIVSCLASTIVLTDIFGLLLRLIGLPGSVYTNRNVVIGILATFVLYPLSILKDLSALKSVSLFGIAGHLTAMGALAVRILDKSYFPGGVFAAPLLAPKKAANAAKAASIAAQKAASAPGGNAAKWLVLASLLSYCFVTHYNAPKYFNELEEKDRNAPQFLKMVTTSYVNGAAIYIGTCALGMALFGAGSASFALNSFSPLDPLGTVARFSFGASVLASYPLIFLAMRNWFVAKATKHTPSIAEVPKISALLLGFIALLTSQFKDIGVVGSISGGILGSSMMFVFPPIMYLRAMQKNVKGGGKPAAAWVVLLNTVLLLLGSALGLAGTASSIMASMVK